MKKILKKHKKLNIDFYLYDSLLFFVISIVQQQLKDGKKESQKFIFIFETAKQMFIIAGKTSFGEREREKEKRQKNI